MRKALKAATLMGLTAALIVPVSPSAKAGDMSMGDTKISIGGQLRERLEWWASEAGSGNGRDIIGSYRARIKIKAELSDGVTAVFVPQAVGVWGEGGQGLRLGEKATVDNGASATTNTVNMHEAYMLLSNPFGINNVIVKVGRQEVNLGNQRLVGAVGWSMAGRSLDGILVGYAAGDYGLAAAFYGKLKQGDYGLGAWANPKGVDDIDLYVATWQGKLKPFGIGGTYEITDILVNPTAADSNINTIYGRLTPVFGMDFGKLKFNLEGAYQSGDAGNDDYDAYFFSVGAGAAFTNVAMKPSIDINYDYYSGDSDDSGDVETFWSVLPTAHKWLGHADLIWIGNVYKFNGAGLGQRSPGVTDIYGNIGLNPFAKTHINLAAHYFKAPEDYAVGVGVKPAGYNGDTSDDIGWEIDLEGKYKYSKNLCFLFGWEHFDPDSDFGKTYLSGGDDAEDHFFVQADLKF